MAALAEGLVDLHPLLAAPLVVGLPGALYLYVAARRGNMTAAALIARVGVPIG